MTTQRNPADTAHPWMPPNRHKTSLDNMRRPTPRWTHNTIPGTLIASPDTTPTTGDPRAAPNESAEATSLGNPRIIGPNDSLMQMPRTLRTDAGPPKAGGRSLLRLLAVGIIMGIGNNS